MFIYKNTKSSGITLIALVVTIIVLLILAGISISMLSGDNSILQKVTDAKTNTDNSQIKERIQLAYHSALIKDITGENGELTMPTLQTELNNEFEGKTVTITPSADNKEWTIKVDNVEVTVMAGKDNIQVGVKDKNGVEIVTTKETTPFLPNPSNNEITNNDLITGLTIKDENQNEWVWIVVPKSEITVYKTAGVGQTLPEVPDNSENSIYTKIETDLREYCATDKDGETFMTNSSSYIDEYEEGRGSNITSNNIYIIYKQKMLKSVYENGGFYIGKYEAGTETPRGALTDSLTTATIKQNVYPYNYVTKVQAEDLAEEFSTGERTTTLLFGIQWNLVLKHLNELGVPKSDLTGSSVSWGNYYNRKFVIDRGEYSVTSPWNVFVPHTVETTNKVKIISGVSQKSSTSDTNKILLTTGASDENSKMNIYDLAGNLWEWTLEKNRNGYSCQRGGGFRNQYNRAPYYRGNDMVYDRHGTNEDTRIQSCTILNVF